MPGPCDDLRVIDLSSGPAGGMATMVLADFGADVVKVERPGGDPLRELPSAPMWLRGKRSVELDLRQPEARTKLLDLVRGADVVVSSFRPGRAERLGADAATLRAVNPRLVYCSITGWGPRGPYASYPVGDHLVAAKSGRMRALNYPTGERPRFMPVQVGTHATAQSALSGILAALLVRDGTGAGQVVETSLLQGQFSYDLAGLLRQHLLKLMAERGEAPPPPPASHRNMSQYIPVQAGDGRWIQFASLMEHLFHAMIAALGLEEIYADPRFATAPEMAHEDRMELHRRILAAARTKTSDEWKALFAEMPNVAAARFETPQESLHHPDLIANGEVAETDHPRLGRLRQLGPLARLTRTPGAVGGPFPGPGEHTAEVLGAPDRGVAAPVTAASAGEAPKHALEGITVVNFASIIAAPLAAALLGDMGARVIKIEPPGGDPYRGMMAGMLGFAGMTKTTANQESICIDLRQPEGQRIAQQICAKADVVIHNFRPGVPEKLGIGYDELSALNPRLVYVSANGFGPDGPNALRACAHPIPGAADGGALLQAGAAGAPSALGTLDEAMASSQWLYISNESSPDPNTSVAAASAALLALYARRRTGEGQKVYISMLGANGYANYDDFLSYEGKPPRPTVDADLNGFAATYRLYPARTGWVFLGLAGDRDWARFCELAGAGDLAADPRSATAEARKANDASLADELGRLFATRDAAAWEQLLAPEDVPCVRADEYDYGTFFAKDEQMRANGFDTWTEHPVLGRFQRWGPTVVFSETPGDYRPGTLAGEYTDRILAELGYGPEAVAGLRGAGVVSSKDQP